MYAGYTNKVSPQWRSYVALKKRFSEDELVALCEHKNPMIRCYAFEALVASCSSKTYDVLIHHLSDTAGFLCSMGCFMEYCRVTDNMLFEVGYHNKAETQFPLSLQQYDFIDSVLLFREEIKERSGGSIEYPSRRYTLERLKAKPHFYNRVREIVNAGTYEALPLLAQYKNPADTSIFISLLLNDEFSNVGRVRIHYVRKSIVNFPHISFYPVLKKLLLEEIGTNEISDDYESFPLYEALAQYPTNDTKELFEVALNKSGIEFNSRSKSIYDAVREYPSKMLDSVVKVLPVNDFK